jgi:hypothetical protein
MNEFLLALRNEVVEVVAGTVGSDVNLAAKIFSNRDIQIALNMLDPENPHHDTDISVAIKRFDFAVYRARKLAGSLQPGLMTEQDMYDIIEACKMHDRYFGDALIDWLHTNESHDLARELEMLRDD